MLIEWILDTDFPQSILTRMQQAADAAPLCEGIHVPCSATVRLCTDEAIAEINAAHRSVPHATDVLSFPAVSYPEGKTAGDCEKLLRSEYDDETGTCFLGDIIISVPHILAQAQEYGHPVEREASYLLVHGLCHLMGYDHITASDKQKMRILEEQILLCPDV